MRFWFTLIILTIIVGSCGVDPCEATNANFVEMTVDGQPFVPTTVKATRTVYGMEIKFKNEELEINIRTRRPTGTFNVALPSSENTTEDAWVEYIKKTGSYKFAESGSVNISSCNILTSGNFNFAIADIVVNGAFQDIETGDLSLFSSLITKITSESLTCTNNDCTPSIREFEYDSKGRVVAIFANPSNLFIYGDNKLIGAELVKESLSKYNLRFENGMLSSVYVIDWWIGTSYEYFKNADGMVIGYNYVNTYKNSYPNSCSVRAEIVENNYNNIIYECAYYFSGDSTESLLQVEQYDDKKNASLSMKKAFIDDPVFLSSFLNIHGKILDLSENNPIKSGDNLYTYKYNNLGYPTSILRIQNGDSLLRTIEYSN